MALQARQAGSGSLSDLWVLRAGTALLRRLRPGGLAFRLYAILALSVTTVVALSLVSFRLAGMTHEATSSLSRNSLGALVIAADLDMLLARHRRLVRSAPIDTEPERLQQLGWARAEIEGRMTAALAGAPELAVQLQPLLRRLTDAASAVVAPPALEGLAPAQLMTEYDAAARTIGDALREAARRQASAAEGIVVELAERARTLSLWSAFALLLALAALAPIGIVVLGDGSRRLQSVWQVMRRIARNETDAPIPSIADTDEIGEMARAVEVFKDNARALARQRSEIQRVNDWLDIALNNMSRGLSMFDGHSRLVLCNARYRTMYDLPIALTAHGTTIEAILAHRRTSTQRLERVQAGKAPEPTTLLELIASRTAAESHQYMTDGRIIALAMQPLDDGGWVAVHEDVTHERAAEARIEDLARHDALTRLSNRLVFREELERRCSAGATSFALQIIDLDHFKRVNDTLGHAAGDALLEAVAKRLRTATRDTDVVARLGGDEFAVLQDAVTDEPEALALGRRIVATLTEPFDVAGSRLQIGASVGIAIAPRDGTTAAQLFSHADLALYRSKETGRGQCLVFRAVFREEMAAQRALENDLAEAIRSRQFELHYQPIIDVLTGTVVACEALLRWRHPTRGMVPPMDFIPYAEASGLIVPIGRWALEQACRDAATWPPGVAVSVNLSVAQVSGVDLIDDVTRALLFARLPAHRLELEVTETLKLDERGAARDTLLALRAAGVRISLDDFGTGYASLSYLRRFPFDKIKIDQMFVRDLPSSPDSVAIVRAVASLSENLDMVAVAEGVETAEHLARVQEAGCQQAQGYLFSRPVPAREIAALLGRPRWSIAARVA